MRNLNLLIVGILLLSGCATNGNTYHSYNQISQSLDDIHDTAQKIKEAKEEYRRYNNEGDDYLKNKVKERLEQRKQEITSKRERLKQDWHDIFG